MTSLVYKHSKCELVSATIMDILYQDAMIEAGIPVPMPAGPRLPWRHHARDDIFENMRDWEFRQRFRFSKDGVLRICDLLAPYVHYDQRSHCLTPLQSLCLTLSFLGGHEFQRTTVTISFRYATIDKYYKNSKKYVCFVWRQFTKNIYIGHTN